MKAHVHIPRLEYKSKLEQDYASILALRQRAGEIVSWAYEPMTLRLAQKTTYTPDFLLLFPDGHIELHETKGFMYDDANVKIKVASALFPYFDFVLVQHTKKTGWTFKEYPHQ